MQNIQAFPELGLRRQPDVLELAVELGQLGLQGVELGVAALDRPVEVGAVLALRRDVDPLDVDDEDETGLSALALGARG